MAIQYPRDRDLKAIIDNKAVIYTVSRSAQLGRPEPGRRRRRFAQFGCRTLGASAAPVVDEDDTGGVEFVCVVRRRRINELIPGDGLAF